MNRGHSDEAGEESKYGLDEECKRDLEEYVRLVNKNTEFFTTEHPDNILEELMGYFQEKG